MEGKLLEYANDFVALLATVLVIVAYHVYLNRLSRRDPTAVLRDLAIRAREAWVQTMMTDATHGVLAVQTLRNSSMAATFLASTAVLLMIGVMTLTGQSPALKETWHFLNLVGTLHPEVWLAKILCMLLVLFFAFFSFANAIRIFNHVGYMINVRSANGTPVFPPRLVAGELNRGGRHFSLGVRAFYYVIPLVCWLFGPLFMVGAALVLVTVLLRRVDCTRGEARGAVS